MSAPGPWFPASNGGGARPWFVMRERDSERPGGSADNHYDKRGVLVRYATRQSALRRARLLNESEVAELTTPVTEAATPAEATRRLLEIAAALGATALSVGTLHPRLSNLAWPFQPARSIFTPPDECYDGWCVAWEIARRAGIYSGCGNHGQAQCNTAYLEHGVWERTDGQWRKIDDDAIGQSPTERVS